MFCFASVFIFAEGVIQDNDTLVFINFRADRMREIVEVFGVRPKFDSDVVRANLNVVQMTQYNVCNGWKLLFMFVNLPVISRVYVSQESFVNLPVIFKPQTFENVLAEWLSVHHVKQFHTAETEKYACLPTPHWNRIIV